MPGGWLILIGLLLVFSNEAMQAAHRAAQVYATSVLPALFPMMVVGSLLGEQFPSSTARTGQTLFQILFGFCAGSPASARQLTLLDHHKPLSHAEYRFLICASGVMSPMFFTGTLAGRLGSRAAWMLLIVHWLGALTTGGISLVCSRLFCTKQTGYLQTAIAPESCIPPNRKQFQPASAQPQARMPLSKSFTTAIEKSANAQLAIVGAMMVFSIAAAMVRALCAHLFPAWNAAQSPWLAILWAWMEIGGGALAVIDAFPVPPLWLLCALCSFGGLSIWLQNLLFLKQKLHPAELLAWRLLHGVLSGMLCYLLSEGTAIAAWTGIPTLAVPFTFQVHTNLLPLSVLLILAAHPWRDPSSP